jgi:hypothetical protein
LKRAPEQPNACFSGTALAASHAFKMCQAASSQILDERGGGGF